MTSRNPHYSVKHPAHPPARPVPLPPHARARAPLAPLAPLTRATRLAHYGPGPLTPAQRRRAAAKAHRYGTAEARAQRAAQARTAAIAAAASARDQVLLGRIRQLPPIRWGRPARQQARTAQGGSG